MDRNNMTHLPGFNEMIDRGHRHSMFGGSDHVDTSNMQCEADSARSAIFGSNSWPQTGKGGGLSQSSKPQTQCDTRTYDETPLVTRKTNTYDTVPPKNEQLAKYRWRIGDAFNEEKHEAAKPLDSKPICWKIDDMQQNGEMMRLKNYGDANSCWKMKEELYQVSIEGEDNVYWEMKKVTFTPHSVYCNFSDRIKTFDDFRCPGKIAKRAKEFAYTGLYYMGTADQLRCFACNVGIEAWENSDDIRFEHKKWSPKCPHLKKTCPQLFY